MRLLEEVFDEPYYHVLLSIPKCFLCSVSFLIVNFTFEYSDTDRHKLTREAALRQVGLAPPPLRVHGHSCEREPLAGAP